MRNKYIQIEYCFLMYSKIMHTLFEILLRSHLHRTEKFCSFLPYSSYKLNPKKTSIQTNFVLGLIYIISNQTKQICVKIRSPYTLNRKPKDIKIK